MPSDPQLTDQEVSLVADYVRSLARAGLVDVRREGRRRYYRARPDSVGALREWLESSWDDALYKLKLAAELEEARRGPAPQPKGRSR